MTVDIMMFSGRGPHVPAAAQRAVEFVSAADDESSLALLNVQSPETGSGEDSSHTDRGGAVIKELSERAGIRYMTYDAEIRVVGDTEQAIIDAAEEYDTICVGATRSGTISQVLFGSLPETVGVEMDRTIVMARGPEESAMSIREPLLRRLEV
ncbi:universal stress protein [Halorubrum sp. CSM-61]|uniref:universal stress protein n=1 Tax=Halorubrum sp. CSM-61 TaxID=2485838 RepID=UPI000F4BB2A3|nr:universal stress protein [Halorubrum sp. CSM-61]